MKIFFTVSFLALISANLFAANPSIGNRSFSCVNGNLGQALFVNLQNDAISIRITNRVSGVQTFNQGTLSLDAADILTFTLENPAQTVRMSKSSLASPHGKLYVQLGNDWFKCNKN